MDSSDLVSATVGLLGTGASIFSFPGTMLNFIWDVEHVTEASFLPLV